MQLLSPPSISSADGSSDGNNDVSSDASSDGNNDANYDTTDWGNVWKWMSKLILVNRVIEKGLANPVNFRRSVSKVIEELLEDVKSDKMSNPTTCGRWITFCFVCTNRFGSEIKVCILSPTCPFQHGSVSRQTRPCAWIVLTDCHRISQVWGCSDFNHQAPIRGALWLVQAFAPPPPQILP